MNRTSVSELRQHFSLPSVEAAASADALESYCPSDGSLLGRVPASGAAGYDRVMIQAVAAARAWADVPAPQRGDLVRHIGNELRQHKRELAELVSLENGKIIAEGLGEVQEMIDMADLAIGQSRMLYGRTMHSERSRHV
jgi:aldehyde dehydrogenase (NAD+)